MSPKEAAGYSGTPLAGKLGIRAGHRVATLGAPEGFDDLVAPLPAGVALRRDPRGGGPFDVVIAFVTSESELRRRFSRGDALLETNGGLWIAWPKQSSARATDLKESHVRAHGLDAGLVDNKICAVDADWSGLRFVVRTADRPARTLLQQTRGRRHPSP